MIKITRKRITLVAIALLIGPTSVCAQSTIGHATSGPTPSSDSSEQPGGVGLLITSDKPAHFVVQYVLPEMAAARANIQIGDEVLAVDDVSVDGVKNIDGLVAKIRGRAGTSVKLTISNSGKTRNLILVRTLVPSKKPVVDVDYGREKGVWFYQREDILPARADQTGMFVDRSLRNFLMQKINER